MIKHCAKCKTIKNLLPQPYSRRVLKDGTRTGSYVCRSCNAERGRRYRKTSGGSAVTYANKLEQNKKYPEKLKARYTVRDALKYGRLKRPEACSQCDSNQSLDAHHHDYTKPLDVTWLCRRCHIALHQVL